jgi:hypothetical protein
VRLLRIAILAGLLLAASATSSWASVASRESRPRQPIRVVVVPGLNLSDLQGLSNRGAAIGLLVPEAGPRASLRQAYEAMIRGKLYNARLGSEPRGHILIDAKEMATPPLRGPTIIVGLPPAIETGNDVRYPIAVFGYGYHGVLCSPLTRMCGLVSMADVVPTALQWQRPLRAQRVANPMLTLTRLEERIETSRASTFLALVVVMSIALALGFWRRRAAACGVLAALAVNLALGASGAGGATQQIFLLAVATAFGGAVGPRVLRAFGEIRATRLAAQTDARAKPARPESGAASGAAGDGLGLGLACVAVLAAYTATMAFDPSVLSLATMGPELTARFYGVSNLLETLLLVPALLGAKLLGERLGPAAFLGVAALALAAVAENRLGADGGGAIVLGVAFAALGVRMLGRGVGAFAGALAGAGLLVYSLVAIDAAFTGPDHLRGAIGGGWHGLAASAFSRVPLSYGRMLDQWWMIFPLGWVLLLGVLSLRSARTRGDSALRISYLAAVGISLLVNDSPGTVSLAALGAFAAVADPYLREELLLPLWARVAPAGRPTEPQPIITR